jgi:sodium transport system permease protein
MMIFIIMPAVSAMLPGVELSKAMTFVPILNVSLLSKEMVSGSFPLGTMALIFLSSCVYGALALALAVYMFKRESVLFRT